MPFTKAKKPVAHAKEAIDAARRQDATERPVAEPTTGKAFVDIFLQANAQLLGELYSACTAVTAERSAWIGSGAAEQIVDMYAEVLPQVRGDRDSYVKLETAVLYCSEEDLSRPSANKARNWLDRAIMPQLPLRVREALMEIDRIEDEHASNYSSAIRAVVDQRGAVFEKALEQWKAFMVGDYAHASAFHDFMVSGQFAQSRAEHKEFLRLLERWNRQSRGVADASATLRDELIKNELSHPGERVFDEFVLHLITRLETRNPRTMAQNGVRDLLEWMKMISFSGADAGASGTDINTRAVLDTMARTGIFPDSLQKEYASYLKMKLTQSLGPAIHALSAYRGGGDTVPSLRAELRTTRHRRNGRPVFQTKPVFTAESVDEVTKQRYRLLLSGDGEESHHTLSKFVHDSVRKISPNSGPMAADIFRIIKSLVEDPRGLGSSMMAKSLSVHSPYSNAKVRLWHYRADRRPGVNFEDPTSRKLRVMYYFDPSVPDAVVLQSVLTHDQFDVRYAP